MQKMSMQKQLLELSKYDRQVQISLWNKKALSFGKQFCGVLIVPTKISRDHKSAAYCIPVQ